ncbi:MAG: rhodanese-like domain-containing protein [Pseudomonadota bacterium]
MSKFASARVQRLWSGYRKLATGGNLAIAAIVVLAAVFFSALTVQGFAEASNWKDTKEWVRTDFPEAPQLSVTELAKTLEGSSKTPLIVDVREPEEYAVSHIPGAVNAQGAELERLVSEAGPDRPIVLYCSVGYRSSRETEKLLEKGYRNISNLEGSIFEWANTGHPLVQGGPSSQLATDAVHPFDEEWGVLLDAERRSYTPRQ